MPLGRYGVVLLAAAAASSHWSETSAWAPFVSHRTRPHRITTPRLMSTSPANAVKRLPDSAVELAIPVPAAATQAAYDKVCRELARTVQIPGFRKGSRIPPPVLEQALAAKGGRNALKTQAINELVGTLVEPALKDANLQPIGQPTLLVPAEELANDFEAGKSVTLTVRCDVWPDVEWKRDPDRADDPDAKPYLGLTGSYRRKPFNQPKLDLALNDLRERYATLVPITDAEYRLQMGDACTVNMVGYLATPQGDKGEPLPNAASGDRVEVILGTGRYMEGLVEGLVGAKVGETKAVQVNFPEKLRDKSLAGKRAIFDVEVLEASERQVPEVTDEFANQVKAGLTADTLLAELRKAIDAEDAKEFTPARNKALGQALADVMDMQVPDTLVSNQAREKFAVMMSEMRDSGVSDEEIKRQINPENFAKYKEIVKDDIIKDFKVSIAADEIGRLENVQVPDYQVEEQMEAIRKDAAESKQELDENMIRGKVEATLQRQAVFDWLAERSQLQVEFEDDYFDEALMEKLAKESLEREEQIAAGKAATPESGKLEPVGVEAPAAVDAAVEENVVPVPAETEPEPKTEKKEDETVVETTAPEPVPEEEQKDPVVAETTEDEEAKKERYASMTLEDRAFAILQDIGLAGGDETTTKK